MTEYPFTSGDALATKNRYDYFPFGGEAFLDAWSAARAATRTACAAAPTGHRARTASTTPTHRLVANISFADYPNTPPAQLSMLIQRFEITGRLHAAYNAQWRAINKTDFHHLDDYLLFGEQLCLAWDYYHRLDFVNALLKLLDTLSTQVAHLDRTQRERCIGLIDRESRILAEVANG